MPPVTGPTIPSFVNLNTIYQMLERRIGSLTNHEKIVELSKRILQIPLLNLNKLKFSLRGHLLIVSYEDYFAPYLQEYLVNVSHFETEARRPFSSRSLGRLSK